MPACDASFEVPHGISSIVRLNSKGEEVKSGEFNSLEISDPNVTIEMNMRVFVRPRDAVAMGMTRDRSASGGQVLVGNPWNGMM